jgi:hypothetical protein
MSIHLAPVLAIADAPLTVMLVGAIVLAGATVVATAFPDIRWRRRRAAPSVASSTPQPASIQRRVITGRAVALPPTGTPLPITPTTPPAAGQRATMPDGPRPAGAQAARAEAMIDHFLDTDPEILAATMAAWIAQDDRPHRGQERP